MSTCMVMPASTTNMIIRIRMIIIMNMERAVLTIIMRIAGTIILMSLSQHRSTFIPTKTRPAAWFLT